MGKAAIFAGNGNIKVLGTAIVDRNGVTLTGSGITALSDSTSTGLSIVQTTTGAMNKILGSSDVGATLAGGVISLTLTAAPNIGWNNSLIKTTTGAYTVVSGDNGYLIVSTGTGTQAMTLPTDATSGYRVTFLKSNSTSGDLEVYPHNATTATLNGITNTAVVLPSIGSWCTMIYNTSNAWYYIGNF